MVKSFPDVRTANRIRNGRKDITFLSAIPEMVNNMKKA